MINKIKKTINAYLTTNEDVLSAIEKADLNAQISFLEDLGENKNVSYFEKYEKAKKSLFTILRRKKNCNEDIMLTRSEFLDIYCMAMESLGLDKCELDGNDVTVHWNGICCDCGDGAASYNYIISNIEGVIEDEDEDM